MTFLLPPLNALRSFEAAARHRGFQRAAAELHVTAGAVGQQVRAFEDQLGVALFNRAHNRLVLTEAGRSYARAVHEAFQLLSTATAALGASHPAGVIRLGVRTGLRVNGPGGLLPLIEGFRRSVGAVRSFTVRVYQPAGLAELSEGKIDVAVLGVADQPDGFRRDFLPGIGGGRGDNYLVAPEGTADCPEIVALREWLLNIETEPLAKRA